MAAEGGQPTPAEGKAPRSAAVRPAPSPSALVPPAPSPSPSGAPLNASPSAPDRYHVVQVGDTLWGIATQYFGDPERWPAIFDLNVGRPQPDGRTLVDPDLIYPGWRLELPGSQPAEALDPQPHLPPSRTEGQAVVRPSNPRPERTGVELALTAGLGQRLLWPGKSSSITPSKTRVATCCFRSIECLLDPSESMEYVIRSVAVRSFRPPPSFQLDAPKVRTS